MPILRLVPADGDPVIVEAEDALVGREPSCHIVIADSSVSRQHAILRRAGEVFSVEDPDSANGTFLNSRRILKKEAIGAGDKLAFGSVEYAVEIVDDAEIASLNEDQFVSGRTLFASSEVSFVQTREGPLPTPPEEPAAASPAKASPLEPLPAEPLPASEPKRPRRSPTPPPERTQAPEAPPEGSRKARLQPTTPISAEQIAAEAKAPAQAFPTMFWLGIVGLGCLAVVLVIAIIGLAVLFLRLPS